MKRVRTKESYDELAQYKLHKASVFKACLVGAVPMGNRPKPRYEYINIESELKVGDKIRVFDLPSYKQAEKPDLPIITEVMEITDWPLIIVNIDNKTFELYSDDGYERVWD